jgi:hypothetical protein
MFATVAGRMQVRNAAAVISLAEAELVTPERLSARARTFAVRHDLLVTCPDYN